MSSDTDSETDDKNANGKEDQQRLLKSDDNNASTPNADDSYSDSGNSTEYSYTYQDNKNEDLEIQPHRSQFRDVELQHIPDYISMNIFHDDNLNEDNSSHPKIEGNTSHAITLTYDDESQDHDQFLRNRRTLETIYSTDNTDTDDVISVKDSKNSIYFSRQSIVKVKKWLKGKSMFQPKNTKKEKFINLLNLRKYDNTISTLEQRNSSSEEEEYSETKPLLMHEATENTEEFHENLSPYTTNDDNESITSSKKSYYFSNDNKSNTENEPSTSIQEVLQEEEIEEISEEENKVVPVLKLTSSSSKSDNEVTPTDINTTKSDTSPYSNKMNYLFPKVSYTEETERNYSPSQTSCTKSCDRSSLTRRKYKTESTDVPSPISSSSNSQNVKEYNKKVHSYYRNFPLQKFDTPKQKEEQKCKQTRLSKILSRLF